jgi:glycosyltransferase involved in cell wall biosynthesis
MSPDLSVVICSLNGAAGIDQCLHPLSGQTSHSRLEIIVVDDGSTDLTREARTHGAIVVRHAANCVLAAVRNSGIAAASAPNAEFLDDDCEPERQWAEQLLVGYTHCVAGIGGPILPQGPACFSAVTRKDITPRSSGVQPPSKSDKSAYRHTSGGGNMSFKRRTLLEMGRFDERFQFSSEEVDLCRRPVLAPHRHARSSTRTLV